MGLICVTVANVRLIGVFCGHCRTCDGATYNLMYIVTERINKLPDVKLHNYYQVFEGADLENTFA